MSLYRTHRTRLVYGLLLLGIAAGLLLAEAAARYLRLRDGRRSLDTYTLQLQQAAVQVDQEGERAINTVLQDHLTACSPEELRLMRGIVYNSLEIKDVGRVRNGIFVCSGEVGVLPERIPMPPVRASFRNMSIYGWVPVMFGAQNSGFIVQVRDVSIVLNPRAFEAFTTPSRSFASYFYDQRSRTLIQGFGAVMPLSPDEIMASREVFRNGIFYKPLCSAHNFVCVVASGSKAAMLATSEPLHLVLLLAGASIGDTVALAFLLLYQRQRSQTKQLRRAVRRGELNVLYQPIVDLQTRAVVSLEALARWTNEDGEIVPPDVFIAIAEQRSFVSEITRLVVRRCLSELGDEMRTNTVRVTVNITAQDLNDPTFLSFLQTALDTTRIAPAQLGLELTERSATNQPTAIQTIARLRQAGHTVYIDDFGTGYSSLACLADINADAIKIDRAFTASVGTQSLTESILPQVMQMARQLKLAVVVEGIETPQQAQYFEQGHAGTLGQGWLFGRPMPAAQAALRLRQPIEPHPGDA
jgi:sensor c-di-GMP phosphodiesterase-like protein